jgi:hypothetical protein
VAEPPILTEKGDTRLLVGLRHPMRRRTLVAMAAAGEDSPTEADNFGEPPANVAHHVCVLRAREDGESVAEVPVSGPARHFHEHAITKPWAPGVLGPDADGDDQLGSMPRSD